MYDAEYAFGTMTLTMITMHALFDGAVESEFLVRNPAQNLKCKQREVKEARVLTKEEQDELLKYAKGSYYYNAFVLALEIGLRPGELTGLQWEFVDLDKRELYVRKTLLYEKSKGGWYLGEPKNKSSVRTIPLTDKAI